MLMDYAQQEMRFALELEAMERSAREAIIRGRNSGAYWPPTFIGRLCAAWRVLLGEVAIHKGPVYLVLGDRK